MIDRGELIMLENKQFVTIKGTRDGLTIFLDDSCAFHVLLDELQDIISKSKRKKDEPTVKVTVQLGYRYLQKEQEDKLIGLIGKDSGLAVEKIESKVILKEEALKWKDETEVKIMDRLVRSGQVLEVTGDLLLIGDVNPGGKVIATGNIYILGNLLGIAHAGSNGDKNAVIIASYMKPNQLRIADYISRAPDYESIGLYMECGFVDEEQDKITIDKLQVLSQKRRDLSGFERRMQNG